MATRPSWDVLLVSGQMRGALGFFLLLFASSGKIIEESERHVTSRLARASPKSLRGQLTAKYSAFNILPYSARFSGPVSTRDAGLGLSALPLGNQFLFAWERGKTRNEQKKSFFCTLQDEGRPPSRFRVASCRDATLLCAVRHNSDSQRARCAQRSIRDSAPGDSRGQGVNPSAIREDRTLEDAKMRTNSFAG